MHPNLKRLILPMSAQYYVKKTAKSTISSGHFLYRQLCQLYFEKENYVNSRYRAFLHKKVDCFFLLVYIGFAILNGPYNSVVLTIHQHSNSSGFDFSLCLDRHAVIIPTSWKTWTLDENNEEKTWHLEANQTD